MGFLRIPAAKNPPGAILIVTSERHAPRSDASASCDEALELWNSDGGLLFRGAGKAATKPLGFAPGLTNLFAKMHELVGYLDQDESDHG